jgi:hypothetical protein
MNSTVASFFLQQLHPYHQHVEDIAEIDFIPYGTTRKELDGSFTCVNGDIQCRSNKIHVIIIYYNIKIYIKLMIFYLTLHTRHV